MNFPSRLKEQRSVFFYSTGSSAAPECNSLWCSSLRGERQFPTFISAESEDCGHHEKQKNFLRKHSRSSSRKKHVEGVPCEACNRPSRKDIDTPEYWRRVRSLSRENRLRLDSRENQLRLAELEEARRRKDILARRKNERDDLANRYLRNPLKAFRNCSVDSENSKEDRYSVSRSVPDLEEAFKIIREGQLAKARSQTLTNSTYESWSKQRDRDSPLISSQFTHAISSSQTELKTSPRKNKKENQKAYPTRPIEELRARHSRYHNDDEIPFSRSSRLRKKYCQKNSPDEDKSLPPPHKSASLPDGHIIIVQKPKFVRRRSMPDLANCKCIRSTVVFESVASLDDPENSEEMIILQRGPPRHKSSDARISRKSSYLISKAANNNNKEHPGNSYSTMTEDFNAKVNRRLITCTEKYMKTSSYFQISRRKEWTADQMSKSELKRTVIPNKETRSKTSTTHAPASIREKLPAFFNKHLTTSTTDGNESSYYDSLEEVNGSEAKIKKAFFVALEDEVPESPSTKEIKAPAPKRLTARKQEQNTLRRPRTAFTSIKDPNLPESKIYPLDIEALLLSGNHPGELEFLSEFASKSLDLNKNGKLQLSTSSVDLLTSKLPELIISKNTSSACNGNGADNDMVIGSQGTMLNGYIDIVSDQVFHIRNESRFVNVNNNNKTFETCSTFSNPPSNKPSPPSQQLNSSCIGSNNINACGTSNELKNSPNSTDGNNILPNIDNELTSFNSETSDIHINKTYSIDSLSDCQSLADWATVDDADMQTEICLKTYEECNGTSSDKKEESKSPIEKDANVIEGFASQNRETLLESGFGGDEDMSIESDNGSISSKDSLSSKEENPSSRNMNIGVMYELCDTESEEEQDNSSSSTEEDSICASSENKNSKEFTIVSSKTGSQKGHDDAMGEGTEKDQEIFHENSSLSERQTICLEENKDTNTFPEGEPTDRELSTSSENSIEGEFPIANSTHNSEESEGTITDDLSLQEAKPNCKLNDGLEIEKDTAHYHSFDLCDDGTNSDSTISSDQITVIRNSPYGSRHSHSANSLATLPDIESDRNTPTRSLDSAEDQTNRSTSEANHLISRTLECKNTSDTKLELTDNKETANFTNCINVPENNDELNMRIIQEDCLELEESIVSEEINSIDYNEELEGFQMPCDHDETNIVEDDQCIIDGNENEETGTPECVVAVSEDCILTNQTTEVIFATLNEEVCSNSENVEVNDECIDKKNAIEQDVSVNLKNNEIEKPEVCFDSENEEIKSEQGEYFDDSEKEACLNVEEHNSSLKWDDSNECEIDNETKCDLENSEENGISIDIIETEDREQNNFENKESLKNECYEEYESCHKLLDNEDKVECSELEGSLLCIDKIDPVDSNSEDEVANEKCLLVDGIEPESLVEETEVINNTELNIEESEEHQICLQNVEEGNCELRGQPENEEYLNGEEGNADKNSDILDDSQEKDCNLLESKEDNIFPTKIDAKDHELNSNTENSEYLNEQRNEESEECSLSEFIIESASQQFLDNEQNENFDPKSEPNNEDILGSEGNEEHEGCQSLKKGGEMEETDESESDLDVSEECQIFIDKIETELNEQSGVVDNEESLEDDGNGRYEVSHEDNVETEIIYEYLSNVQKSEENTNFLCIGDTDFKDQMCDVNNEECMNVDTELNQEAQDGETTEEIFDLGGMGELREKCQILIEKMNNKNNNSKSEENEECLNNEDISAYEDDLELINGNEPKNENELDQSLEEKTDSNNEEIPEELQIIAEINISEVKDDNKNEEIIVYDKVEVDDECPDLKTQENTLPSEIKVQSLDLPCDNETLVLPEFIYTEATEECNEYSICNELDATTIESDDFEGDHVAENCSYFLNEQSEINSFLSDEESLSLIEINKEESDDMGKRTDEKVDIFGDSKRLEDLLLMGDQSFDYQDELLLINDDLSHELEEEENNDKAKDNELLADIFSAQNPELKQQCQANDSDLSTIEEETETYVSATTDDYKTDESLQYEDIINSDLDNDNCLFNRLQMDSTDKEFGRITNNESTCSETYGNVVSCDDIDMAKKLEDNPCDDLKNNFNCKLQHKSDTLTSVSEDNLGEVYKEEFVNSDTELYCRNNSLENDSSETKFPPKSLIEINEILTAEESNEFTKQSAQIAVTKDMEHLKFSETQTRDLSESVSSNSPIEKLPNINQTSLLNNNCHDSQTDIAKISNVILPSKKIAVKSTNISSFKSNSCKTTNHNFSSNANNSSNKSSISISEKGKTTSKEDNRLKKQKSIKPNEDVASHSETKLTRIMVKPANKDHDLTKKKIQNKKNVSGENKNCKTEKLSSEKVASNVKSKGAIYKTEKSNIGSKGVNYEAEISNHEGDKANNKDSLEEINVTTPEELRSLEAETTDEVKESNSTELLIEDIDDSILVDEPRSDVDMDVILAEGSQCNNIVSKRKNMGALTPQDLEKHMKSNASNEHEEMDDSEGGETKATAEQRECFRLSSNSSLQSVDREMQSISSQEISQDASPQIVASGEHSSDSGVLELAGPSTYSTSLINPTVQNDASLSEYNPELMTLQTATVPDTQCIVSEIIDVPESEPMKARDDGKIFYGAGELPNTPILSDCEITSNLKNRLVYSYLDTLEDGHQFDHQMGIPQSSKFSKNVASVFSSDDECETSSDYTARLLNAFETRRKRRTRSRPQNIDSEEGRNKGFKPPALSNFDSFLASLSRFTTNEECESESQSCFAEERNDVRIEVFTGQNTHDINIKAKNQVRLLVEVSPSTYGAVESKKLKINNREETKRRLNNLSKAKNRDLENENVYRKQVSNCDITVEGTNIQKCFSATTKASMRPLLNKTQNRVSPTTLGMHRSGGDPKEKEQRRIQKSIKTIKNLLKSFN